MGIAIFGNRISIGLHNPGQDLETSVRRIGYYGSGLHESVQVESRRSVGRSQYRDHRDRFGGGFASDTVALRERGADLPPGLFPFPDYMI